MYFRRPAKVRRLKSDSINISLSSPIKSPTCTVVGKPMSLILEDSAATMAMVMASNKKRSHDLKFIILYVTFFVCLREGEKKKSLCMLIVFALFDRGGK
jgi:hypothetical protein